MPLTDATIEQFKRLFNDHDPDIQQLIEACYADRVLFRDPIVERRGKQALAAYLRDAYANVTRCEFDFGAIARSESHVTIPWTMTLEHPRLAGGQPIFVDGVTLLEGSETGIEYHRDYYDVGQLLYENLPLLGRIIRWIRRQAA